MADNQWPSTRASTANAAPRSLLVVVRHAWADVESRTGMLYPLSYRQFPGGRDSNPGLLLARKITGPLRPAQAHLHRFNSVNTL